MIRATDVTEISQPPIVHCLKLSMSNAFLVEGERTILVDTGCSGEGQKIIHLIDRLGLRQKLSLILLTHGHSDHAGAAKFLREQLRVPIAVHKQDLNFLKAGSNGKLQPSKASHRFLIPFVDKPFDPFEPDILIDSNLELFQYGVSGSVIPTPGHTSGSVSVLLAGGQAIVGDLLMGGFLGGTFRPSKPRIHYFVDDFSKVAESLRRVKENSETTVYCGHGGPIHRNEFVRFVQQ